MAKIRELMVTETVTVLPTDTVLEATRRLATNRVGAVLVVQDEKLEGLFSERDLVTRVLAADRDPAKTPVAAVATNTVVCVDVDARVKDVLAIFRDKRFRHLPVTESGKPVGILSIRDFLTFLVGGLERFIDQRKYAKDIAEGDDPYDHLGGAYGK